ncbi:MAG TPA: hypothetical protein VLF87_00745 [Patescibacteria group bacterium]|nr:hypothetical protein [Candidatus Saccharimonadales bacterium]HSX46505.1 hypothetical protein [Patescibacteria group bacterium]
MNTITTRTAIGFPERKEEWNEAPARFTEHTLRIAGHPVMEDWEANYMDKLAEIAASKGGAVLELGYGLGLSSAAIQTRGVDAHFIIECHPDVVTRSIQDLHEGIQASRVHILSGFWQDITPRLRAESFDGILFDTYPLNEEEIHGNHFWFFDEAFRLLRPGGVLTYYSDEVDRFSEKHLAKLEAAGFQRENIDFEIVSVNPPPDCEYWEANTILAPIVHKT